MILPEVTSPDVSGGEVVTLPEVAGDVVISPDVIGGRPVVISPEVEIGTTIFS